MGVRITHTIEKIASVYRVKEGSIEEPKSYVGMNIRTRRCYGCCSQALGCVAIVIVSCSDLLQSI